LILYELLYLIVISDALDALILSYGMFNTRKFYYLYLIKFELETMLPILEDLSHIFNI